MSVKVDGSKVRIFATRKAATDGAKSIGWPVSCVVPVHTRFQEAWALGTGIDVDHVTGLAYLSRERFGELYHDRNDHEPNRRLRRNASSPDELFAVNPASQLEWIKGPGVDRDGHSLAWWKNKAAKWSRSEYDRPKVFIRVITWDRAGQRDEARCGEFAPDNLKGAKEFSKEAVESGGSSQIYGRVEIPYQSGVTFDIGEWKNNASNGWYVWSVNGESFVPVSRNGPFENPDDAVALAKRVARGGQTYDAVITFGSDPEASDFEIWKSFKAWSGEVHYTTDLPKVGGRLREY